LVGYLHCWKKQLLLVTNTVVIHHANVMGQTTVMILLYAPLGKLSCNSDLYLA